MKNTKTIALLLIVAILIGIRAVKTFIIDNHSIVNPPKNTPKIATPTTSQTETPTAEIKITPSKQNIQNINITIPPIATSTKTTASIEIKTPPTNPITQIIKKITGNSCANNPNPIFTHHLTDTSKIINIVIPPNFVGTELKTHSYIETDHTKVPLYAPTDMTLVTGAYYVQGPYRLDFQVSCEVTLRLMHITDPIQTIKDVFLSEPASDSRDQQIKNKVDFKAGDLIGYTTGTNVAGNWDFGLYNSATKNKYADDSKLNWSTIHTTAVCPYDYFAPELKTVYTSRYNLRVNDGAKPDGESFCK
ncbi:MAG: hypothetical protein A3J93_05115 [Candidatus Magasanikbacteria bacterium RIFOXYC2_FULL_42_28]|uniref:Uncharacterized protein n=1 Tax=Candidatus Magasanikbacteria bacterium RIFOXYC2_FULL_42_28 TaxID=1798704 RepID=A0A1F6NV20_9BACT|nr:MAG: hypothetical protein A3J93_05115 [Candidatus Magasanikbacteria bacterium RIFOXYC2_FULL_42_28]